MVKKLNAIVSWILSLVLVCHLLYTSGVFIFGFFNFTLNKVLSLAVMILLGVHVFLCLIILFILHDGTRLEGYKGKNKQTIAQRGTAIIIMGMVHLHVQAFNFISMGEVLSTGQKIFIILTEAIYFGAILTHLGVSLSKSFISLGLIRTDNAQKKFDKIMGVISNILKVVTIFAVAKFVIQW